MHTTRAPLAVIVACNAALAGCATTRVGTTESSAASRPISRQAANPAASPDPNTQTAIVAFGWKSGSDEPHGKGLVAVDVRAGAGQIRERVLTREPVSWCLADHRARVVWFVAEQPEPHLVAYELDSGRRHIAATKMPSLRYSYPDHLEIAYSDARLGALDPYFFRVAGRLDLSARRLSPLVGCDGDNLWYCYADAANTDLERREQGLVPELASAVRELRQAVVQPEALRQIMARAAGGPFWLRGPSETETHLPRVAAVPRSGCSEDPSLCGVARAIPGTGHWLVITGNARGDFYHLYQQVYDPKKAHFLHPARRGAAARAERPFAAQSLEASVDRLLVSPAGDYFLIPHTGQLVSFERGLIHQSSRGCGWSRIGGYLDAMSPPVLLDDDSPH